MNNDYNNDQQQQYQQPQQPQQYDQQQYSGQQYPQQQYNQQQPFNQPYGQSYQQPYGQPYKQPGDSAATISLVCGIISLFFAGIILGIVAVGQASKAKKMGFVGGKATAGMVLGIIGIVGGALLVLLYTVVIGAAATY